MRLLLDTHILLWAASGAEQLSNVARSYIEDTDNTLFFSAASIWEVSIKNGLGRADFRVDPYLLRRGLIDNGYQELPVSSAHAAEVSGLPFIHEDPFDRMLVAQGRYEGMLLLTNDATLSEYGSPVFSV